MAHSFNTIPLRILDDMGVEFKGIDNRKEYSFGKTKASGPGGLNCPCCFPRFGDIRNGKDKPKMRRYVRRVSKMNMVKEIAAEMEALHKEFEDLMDELSYDYDDYDDFIFEDYRDYDNDYYNDVFTSWDHGDIEPEYIAVTE